MIDGADANDSIPGPGLVAELCGTVRVGCPFVSHISHFFHSLTFLHVSGIAFLFLHTFLQMIGRFVH